MDVDNGESGSLARPGVLCVNTSPSEQSTASNQGNSGLLSPGGSMMSPREPRTLSDMMKAAINDYKNSEASASSQNNPVSSPPNTEQSVYLCPVKAGPSTPPPQSSSSSSSAEVSPATPLRLNQIVPTATRVEDLMHSPSRLFKHSMSVDFSGTSMSQQDGLSMSSSASGAGLYPQVWRSPGGTAEQDDCHRDVPNTPPQKKKVSV